MNVRPVHRIIDGRLARHGILVDELKDVKLLAADGLRHTLTDILQPHDVTFIITIETSHEVSHVYITVDLIL
tara:strand:+ start:368 stop:583 length:216 start_codon:yes stop_codon:yes gene_type:complete